VFNISIITADACSAHELIPFSRILPRHLHA
jgi:hypothetical protein